MDAVIDLDNEALDDCLHGEQRPRVDEYENYIFLVVYGLLGSEQEADHRPCKLAVFCGDRFLVTVHRESVRTIEHFRVRCGSMRHNCFSMEWIISYTLFSMAWWTTTSAFPRRTRNGLKSWRTVPNTLQLTTRYYVTSRSCDGVCWSFAGTHVANAASGADIRGRIRLYLGSTWTPVCAPADHLLKVVEQVDGLRELANGVRDKTTRLWRSEPTRPCGCLPCSPRCCCRFR